MKRKIICMLTAVIMMTTIFAMPAVYAADTNMAEEPAVTAESDSNAIADVTDVTEEITESDLPQDSEEPADPEDSVEPEQPAEPVSLAAATVTIAQTSYEFTKKEVKPAVTVKLNGAKLVNGTDYTVTYTKNIYPGTAKITVTGINDYTGTKTKTFEIATVKGLKWEKSTTSTIKLDWTARKNVTGYNVSRYDSSKGKWVFVKTVTSSETTVKNLKAGLGYQFRVKAYYKDSTGTYYSPAGTTVKAPTLPGKVTIKSVLNHPGLYAKISWGKKTATGYQVRYSRYRTFDNCLTAKVTSSSQLSRKIVNLRDNSQYYVKVRAYKTFGNKTVYGAWSNVKAFSTNGTRWWSVNGKKYYYEKGKMFKGTKKFGKHQYYFNSTDGAWSGASQKMWNKVKDSTSKTKYLIAVSRQLNRLCVYEGKKGDWKLKSYWMVSTGRPENGKISKTPTGSWLMPKEDNHLGYIGGHKDYTCWYATRFYGRCFFHSVTYMPASKTQKLDPRLGMNISDGCIRMDIKNAKWIYDNCHTGTRVIVY